MQETVPAAKMVSHELTNEYYDQVGDTVTLKGPALSYPTIEPRSFTGFKYMDYRPKPFMISSTVDDNDVYVYHDRIEDYPYIVDFYTVDPNGSVEVKTD